MKTKHRNVKPFILNFFKLSTMKKMLFAAFAAVAVLGASCSKDPDAGKRTGEVADAVVQIAVDPSMFTRGDFDQIGGDDLTQTAVTVQDGLYVFLGQGADIIVSTDLAQNATSGIMTKDRSGTNLTTAVGKSIILGKLTDGVN